MVKNVIITALVVIHVLSLLRSSQAEVMGQPEPPPKLLIEYHIVQAPYEDDIGLVRLTVEDIEEFL